MKSLSRVIWSEGMHLGPHHFQAQSRYFEDSIQFAISALWPYAWGVSGCELDPEALHNGRIAVLHARGMFPDGLAFNMPECDRLPESRSIQDLFPPTREKVLVSLAVAPRKIDQQNTGLSREDGNGFRYFAETRQLPDETTGRDERPVRVARKNIRLLLDTEDGGDWLTLPVARVMRGGSGHFLPDPSFIPPCLQISASGTLMSLLRRLIEIMEEKSAALAVRESGNRQGFSAREIAAFWFTHSVNASLLPLRHLCFVKHGHPEELYVELSRLAGALFTFALASHPRSVPLYDHRQLDVTFAALDQMIRAHLDLIVPANCLTIPLERSGECYWTGEIRDQRAFDRSNWILGVRSSAGDAAVMERTPRLVKVCSREFVPKLVERALPGLTLTHLATPPAAVSPAVETQYFAINKAGPCWDHIRQTKWVGLYIPQEIPGAEPRLQIVLDTET
ncbi:MAG: type VI secretion system baseplate subunit TssK [Acidobacteriaceae bacterium]|nr:type VI secretion system baseplate subunit TssK [Acidobacteriaceae bacterium]MBV8572663.1 type VI secretion system baseplate subunit TssK [Acidobacteriaceae bacterium]